MHTIKKIKQGLLVFSAAISVGLTAVVAPMAHATTCVDGNWEYGDSGTCVGYIQGLLNMEGNYLRYPNWSHLTEDGQFGTLTERQVKAFQAYKLITQDGEVGPVTWNRLCGTAASIVMDLEMQGAYKTAGALEYLANDAGCNI